MNNKKWEPNGRRDGCLPIVDTSKGHNRDLTMYVSSDLPRIEAMIKNIKSCNAHNPHIDFDVATTNAVHSRVSWKNEDGDKFGFDCQITQANKLLLQNVMDSIDNPNIFPGNRQHHGMMIIIEGSGVNIPIEVKPPTPESKLTMFIAAGENTLMMELQVLFEKIYPGKSHNVVKMMGLHCGGDVNWQLNETGEQVGLIVERKKDADMIASRMDGREAQLPVMIENAPDPSCIFIVVEGNVMSTRSAMDKKAKIGTITYPLLRDGINMASVADTAATAALLVNMHLQMEWCEHKRLDSKNFHFGRNINQGNTKSSFIEPGGKEEMVYTLSVVKGISDETASSIAAHYPTFADLMYAMITSPDPEDMLSNIPITRAGSGTTRALGKAAAKSIMGRFYVGALRSKLVPKYDKDTEYIPLSHHERQMQSARGGRMHHEEADDNDNDNNNSNSNHAKKKAAKGHSYEDYMNRREYDEEYEDRDGDEDENEEREEQEPKQTKPEKQKITPPKKVSWREPKEKKLGPVFEKAKKAAELARKRASEEESGKEDKTLKKKKVEVIDIDDDFFD